jgi:hypothetical protein
MPGFASPIEFRDPDRHVAVARERRDRLRHEGVQAARDLGGGQRIETAAGVKQH